MAWKTTPGWTLVVFVLIPSGKIQIYLKSAARLPTVVPRHNPEGERLVDLKLLCALTGCPNKHGNSV